MIRPATAEDIPAILEMVNRFAAQNVMLPRTESSVRQTIDDWLVGVTDKGQLAGCGSLVGRPA